MADRYFVQSPITADRAVLDGPEAHHLLHVMRAKVGSEATLFDGSGAEFQARVEKLGRSEVELSIMSRQEVDRESATQVVLGVALPKGDRQRWLVEKCTEIGVAQLSPLDTARSVADAGDKSLERLRRNVVEASKQCGRTRLMQVNPACVMVRLHHVGQERPAAYRASRRRFVREVFHDWLTAKSRTVHIVIGPEGGLTDDEVATARGQGWRPVDLGRRILRIETAAVALAGLFTLASE